MKITLPQTGRVPLLLIAALLLSLGLTGCGRKPGTLDTPPGSTRLSYPPTSGATP